MITTWPLKYKLLQRMKDADRHQIGLKVGGKLELLDRPAFKRVNIMIGNVKNSLRGSCRPIRAKQLPRHLAEYCFRFNNRFDWRPMLPKLAKVAVRTPPMPHRLLKASEFHGQSGQVLDLNKIHKPKINTPQYGSQSHYL